MLRTHKLQSLFNRLLALSLTALFIACAALSASAQDDCRLSLRPCTCAAPPPGMVAWWTGDGTAEDIVGGHHGTLHNGAGFTAEGKVGSAFEFDNTGEYVTAPAQGIPTGNAPRTVEAWVYTTPNSWGQNEHTIFEYGVGDTRRAFGLDMDNRPYIQFYTWWDDLLVDTGMSEDGWMHVAVTYDGTTVRVYINGVERANRVYSNGIDTASSDFNIGRSAALGGASYNGRIDELSVYDRALSREEVAAIVRAGRGGKCRYAISGRITDECGFAIAGVAVTAQSARSTLTRSTTTDAQGNYLFLGLPGGADYLITPQVPAGQGGDFAPPFSSFAGLSANQTADFFFRPYRRAVQKPCPAPFDYVSDLLWAGVPIDNNGEPHRDVSVNGTPITLNGVVYPKGLGVHPTRWESSEVTYNLWGRYSSFISDVGLDDETDVVVGCGSVSFQVFADGVLLYNSGTMRGDTATQTINVNVTGVQELKLVTTNAGDGYDCDHGDWANARLVR